MTAPRKPSAAQLRVLDNLIAGRALFASGKLGAPEWATLQALKDRGWIAGRPGIDTIEATPAGREAARHGAR